MSRLKAKSLRYGTLSKERPGDTAEALRDIWTTVGGLTDVRTFVFENLTWVAPFYLDADRPPAAVILGRSKLARQPGAVTGGFVGWTFTPQGVRVDNASGLTVGTAYDLAFVMVF